MTYNYIRTEGAPIKAWTKNVPFDDNALEQVKNIASMPFIHKHVAVMPDVHLGKGATVGSVIATKGAIIPAAVGVDIGCGMMAVQLNLKASDLPDNLAFLRSVIEKAVPHGRTNNGGKNDRGAWSNPPENVLKEWEGLFPKYNEILEKHPKAKAFNNANHLGTLGTGNHFVEMCLDENQDVWIMLHSGSRGVGNRIGSYFIEAAKKDMKRWFINLPDKDLAYIPEGSELFDDYTDALLWSQIYAKRNRKLMMENILTALRRTRLLKPIKTTKKAINCHHNYVTMENHFGSNVWVTRKGAVNAEKDVLGIIPGSMGAKSYIVQGLGNPQSFCSCSHGAGRVMSRGEANKKISLEEHAQATAGVECRKDAGVLDESPAAYKDIDAVMESQKDLVEIVHTLKQVLCVKG